MAEITVKAYAKLNLTLDILRKRDDGYHDMRMVMQSISLHDVVTLRQNGSGKLSLSCNMHYLPSDRGNLAYRAAEAFFEAVAIAGQGVEIVIDKRIPACAGLAGGSADAAAVLCALRQLYRPEMDTEALCAIGARVGSDVPYCIFGGTALAEGRGEVLTRLPSMPECYVVVCKPPFPVSTPEMFGRVQTKRLRRHPDTQGMLRGLEQGELDSIVHRVYNVFEDVLPQKYSEVFTIKNRLLDQGALCACMTGAGPAVFALYAGQDAAEHAAAVLRKDYAQTFLSSIVNV